MEKTVKKLVSALLCVCFAIGFCLVCCSCSFIPKYETYYEVKLEFYVNPRKEGDTDESEYKVYGAYSDEVMTHMTNLLEADAFTLFFLQEQGFAPKETLEDGSENSDFEEWAKSYDYVKYFVGAKEGIEYAFASEIHEDETLSRSFIEVKISVAERELAEIFLQGVKEVVPPFVVENMPIPSGYDGTVCKKISNLEQITERKVNTNKGIII